MSRWERRAGSSCSASHRLGRTGPNWRGPNANGVAPDRTLPIKWSATENVAWKAPIAGAGRLDADRERRSRLRHVADRRRRQARRQPSAPRAGRRRRRTGRTRARRRRGAGADPSKTYFVVEAFGRADGKRVWERRIEATGDLTPVHDKHNLATPSPVTDGTLVYAWFGTGQIVALDRTGAVVWQRHLAKENGAFDIQWGHGSSPVLYGDLLILLCDQPARSYLARPRQEDGQGSLEGGPRPGTRVLQHAARRSRGRSAPRSSSTRPSASTPTTRRPERSSGTPAKPAASRCRRRCSTRA